KRGDLHAEIGCGAVEVRAIDVSKDEGTAIEFLACAFEWIFGRVHGGILQPIPKCRERGLGIVVDGENRAVASDAARRANFGYAVHRHIENLGIGYARNLDVKQFPKSPSGIVVWSFLGIVRAPILMIEQ